MFPMQPNTKILYRVTNEPGYGLICQLFWNFLIMVTCGLAQMTHVRCSLLPPSTSHCVNPYLFYFLLIKNISIAVMCSPTQIAYVWQIKSCASSGTSFSNLILRNTFWDQNRSNRFADARASLYKGSHTKKTFWKNFGWGSRGVGVSPNSKGFYHEKIIFFRQREGGGIQKFPYLKKMGRLNFQKNVICLGWLP